MNDVSVAISEILDQLHSAQLRVAKLEDCIGEFVVALEAIESEAVGIGGGEYSISREVLKKAQETLARRDAL